MADYTTAIEIRATPEQVFDYLVTADGPERVVVSWGVAGSDELPPGSTTVSFTLTPVERGTRVELLHQDLPDARVAGHEHGWSHFLPRLAESAEGRTPTDDPDWRPLLIRGRA